MYLMCVPSIALCQHHFKPITDSKRPGLCSRKSDVISVLFQPHHQEHKVTASISDACWANGSGERGGLSLPWEPVWGPHTHATAEHVAQLGAQSLHVVIIVVSSTHVTVE